MHQVGGPCALLGSSCLLKSTALPPPQHQRHCRRGGGGGGALHPPLHCRGLQTASQQQQASGLPAQNPSTPLHPHICLALIAALRCAVLCFADAPMEGFMRPGCVHLTLNTLLVSAAWRDGKNWPIADWPTNACMHTQSLSACLNERVSNARTNECSIE